MKKDKQSLNISLLSDRVLVLPENEKGEQKTATGIIVPVKETENKLEVGKVVAVGAGRRANDGSRVALDVKIGDRVYFKRGYEVEEITLSGTKYVLLGEINIYAVIG
jgi:chaperonin GroES